ncbi:hypothetical protein ACFX2H_006589 [Malus domestica]
MTLIPTLFSFVKLVSTIHTLSFDQASISNMGSEGSHNTQNDTPRENPIHICSKINDPRVSERLGPLPRSRPAANLGKERHVLEEHEGTWDFEVFRHTCPRSQYNESKEKSHALAQTFLLQINDGDLRKKILVVHDSTQDPIVLQLIEEVNKLKAERQAEIPDWNQPRHGPLTKRILNTLFKRRQNKSLVYNSILEGRTQLNTLTSLSSPWHIRCIPTKNDVFLSPPPSLAEL